MFNKILVPLDGSHLAEAALPPAVWLAQQFGSALVLIHVIEKNPPSEVHGERHLTTLEEAQSYLDKLAAGLPKGVSCETHVHSHEIQDVARSIADHFREFEQDLVVMCTHGKSGLRQWVVGSIAQQVVGMGKVPILLVQPEYQLANEFKGFQQPLVAMDEEPVHDCGLVLGGELARHLKAPLSLLTVVEKWGTLTGNDSAAGRLSPITTAAILDIHEAECLKHLEEHAASYRNEGILVECYVQRGEPVDEIARFAAANHNDVIILGTHGKAGLQAFWSGSVAPRLPGVTGIPLLLVPACA